jgi:hypothetical protein
MKNTIRDLNTIYAFINENLYKKNNITIKLINKDKKLNLNLSSSKMKLFRRYGINN